MSTDWPCSTAGQKNVTQIRTWSDALIVCLYGTDGLYEEMST